MIVVEIIMSVLKAFGGIIKDVWEDCSLYLQGFPPVVLLLIVVVLWVAWVVLAGGRRR